MYLYRSDIYYLLTIVMFVVSLICSGVVRSRFNQYAKCRPRNGMTGAMAAERILRANGIMDVSIAPTAGSLTDNYDPTRDVMHLSEEVYSGTSIASVSIAAHESGHAIQDAKEYSFLKFRVGMVPVVNVVSGAAWPLIIIGIMLAAAGSIQTAGIGNILLNLGIAKFTHILVDDARRLAHIDNSHSCVFF